MIHTFGLGDGVHSFREYLSFRKSDIPDIAVYDAIMPHSYRTLFARKSLAFFAGTYIFSDQVRLNGRQIGRLASMLDTVRRSGLHARILNDPMTYKGRYELLRVLFESGVNRHNAYAVSERRVPGSWPVFVRDALTHWTSPLLQDRCALESYLASLHRQGIWPGDKLIVELNDVRSDDGLYRKYSAFRFGGRIVPAHLMIGEKWFLHSRLDDCPEMMTDRARLDEEMAFLETNPHAEQVMAVFDQVGIDYGRMDYGLVDGRIQVWEINSAPRLLTLKWFTAFEKPRRATVALMSRLYYEAFAALDAPP